MKLIYFKFIRNLDFDWSNKLATLLYDAVFYKNGKEVFLLIKIIGIILHYKYCI
jgi:hypothetical protein